MFIQTLSTDPQFFFSVIIAVVASITVHELAHGYVAVWRGDPTPIHSGHMTANPFVHMAPMSFILLIVAGIAWGSMPVDRTRLRGRYAEAMVSLAGPLSNVLIAVLALVTLGLWQRYGAPASNAMQTLQELLWVLGAINFALAIFNLIPVPPLDGSSALANVSPPFRDLLTKAEATGAATLAFFVLFFVAGRVIFPAATHLATLTLSTIRGY